MTVVVDMQILSHICVLLFYSGRIVLMLTFIMCSQS